MKLYESIARKVSHIIDIDSNDVIEERFQVWRDKLTEELERIERELLPSGSGFDSGTTIDVGRSRKDRIFLSTGFHHMNDAGYYDGWSYHDVIVTPSLQWGFDIRITGRDRNGIKEYIGDTFSYVLDCDAEW